MSTGPLRRFRANAEVRARALEERARQESPAWVREQVADLNQRLDELQSAPNLKQSRFPRLAELRQSLLNPYRPDPLTGEPPPVPKPAAVQLMRQAVDLRPWTRNTQGELRPAFPMGLRLLAFGAAGYYAGARGYDLAHLPALITNGFPNLLDAHWHVSLQRRGAVGAVLGDASGEVPTTLGTAVVRNWLWRRGKRLAERSANMPAPAPTAPAAEVSELALSKPKPKSRR